jgi:small GTP-binding protein
MDENCDYTLKLLIAGDSSVGKTNFIMRFVNNEFNSSYMTTSGIDLKTKDIEVKNKKIRVQIWDTAGQVKYRAITRNLFLKVMGAILIYDITNEKSYNNLKEWMKLIREECGKHMQIIMVGNKCDLDSERKINQDEVMNYAREENIEYIETSCKTGENIEKAVLCSEYTNLAGNFFNTKEIGFINGIVDKLYTTVTKIYPFANTKSTNKQ